MAVDMKNMNLMGIIGLVGALILVIGVFLAWIDAPSVTYSGWDLFQDKDHIANGFVEGNDATLAAHMKGIGMYSYIPLFALICGIISLLLMIVPTFMNTEQFAKINNILGIVALVLGVIVLVLCILILTGALQIETWTVMANHEGPHDVHKIISGDTKLAIGFYLTLVGAIITVVGGVMPILKNKGIIKF